MALTKVSTDGVKDDAVTTDKLANAINTERTANTAKVSTTINNNADNRVITGSGTANTLNGESGLTYDSTTLVVSGSGEVKALSATADNTDKKALFTTGHRDTSEENVSGVVVQGADGDNMVDIGGGQGSYNSATKIRFYTGANATTTTGTEHMRINPDGYIGINETAPSPDSISGATVTSHLQLGVPSGLADRASSIKLIGRDGSNNGNKCQIQWSGAHNRFDITVNGNQALQIQSNKDVEVTDGNLVIGTSGHGIDFSATNNTGTSELLDDYEKGNWTPAVGSGGWSIQNTNFAKYVKVGGLVTAWCYTSITGTGNTDVFKITGLPYAPATDAYCVGSVDFGKGAVKGVYPRVEAHTTGTVAFFYPSENTNLSRLTLAGNQIGANYIIFTVHYFTSA